MSLVDKLKIGAAVCGIASILYNPGCAMRQGEYRVSVFGLPFVPVVWAKQETFTDEDSNEIESEQDIAMSSFLGNVAIDIKRYGKKRTYLGMAQVKIQNNWGEYKITTWEYDENDKLIDEYEGAPSDLPSGVRERTGID